MLISYRRSTSGGNPLTEAFLPKVYDGDFRELSDIRVDRLVHTLGSEPSRAEFTVVLDSYHRWKDGDGNIHDGVLSPGDIINNYNEDAERFGGVIIPAPAALLLGTIGAGFVVWLKRRRTM